MPSAAALRLQIEHALERRFPAALSPAPRTILETATTGIAAVDVLLGGGLPVGAISEVTGQECSGRTSLALAFLGRRTQEGHVCAWVDVEDALDPESAAANGVCLKQLLWVRCSEERRVRKKDGKPWGRLDQAIRATDLLLQAGGFSSIVLDMGGTAAQYARRIPLATWFRFRQAAQRTQCSLVVIGQRACAQSSADVVLECKAAHANADSETVLAGFAYEVRRERARGMDDGQQGHRFPGKSRSDSLWADLAREESILEEQVSGHDLSRADLSSFFLKSERALAREEAESCSDTCHFERHPLQPSKPKTSANAKSFPKKILSFAPAQALSASEANDTRRKPPVSTWSAAGAWDREKRA
jgi:recombination protein RecA